MEANTTTVLTFLKRVKWSSVLALTLIVAIFGFLASMLLVQEWECLRDVCLRSYAEKGVIGWGEESEIVVEVVNRGKEKAEFELVLVPRVEGTVVLEEKQKLGELGRGEERRYRFKTLVNETVEGRYCVDVRLRVKNESVSDDVCLVLKP